MFYSTVVL